MSGIAFEPGRWLGVTLVGGGLLLLVAWRLMLATRQPARRQRLGEWGLVAALTLTGLSFGPPWWRLPSSPIPVRQGLEDLTAADLRDAGEAGSDDGCGESGGPAAAAGVPGGLVWGHYAAEGDDPAPASEKEPIRPEAGGANAWRIPRVTEALVLAWASTASRWLVAAYLATAGVLLARWLLHQVGLWRLVAKASPAPPPAAALLADLAVGRRPRLLVSSRLRVPLSCGVLRPTILLPPALCASPRELRWVLVHELAHLERRDPWTCLLLSLGQVAFFPVPWFWWLRRQVRLCQEHVADAAVTARGEAADYAAFLLTLTGLPPGGAGGHAPPFPLAGATRISGHPSDLFRRVTMILHPTLSVERSCPCLWSHATLVGLLALAVLVSGLNWSAAAPAPQPEPAKKAPTADKEEPKKEELRKQEPNQKEREKRPRPRGPADFDNWVPGLPLDFDKDFPKDLEKMLEDVHKRFGKGGLKMPDVFDGPNVWVGWPHGGGRLGVLVRPPSPTLVEQLDLPKDRGLVVEKVMPDSAAAKAGLKEHDILLEVGGKAVTSDRGELAKALRDVKADAAVDLVVLRKGRKETIKGVKLPEAKAPALPGLPGLKLDLPRLPRVVVPNVPKLAGKFGLTMVTRDGDRFTTRHQDGELVITLKGTVADGKATVSEIQIQEGDATNKYDDVAKVPEKHRDKVKELIESSSRGTIRIEIHP